MHVQRYLILASASLIPAAAHAADPVAPSAAPLASEHRLSDAEVAKVLESAAQKREAAEEVDRPGRQVHGEMGIAIGTGGYSSVHGTAVVPILKDGVAILSFDSTDFGSRGPWGWQGPR